MTVKIRARYPLIAICLVGGIALALSHSKNSAAHRVSMLRGGTPVTFIFQGDKVRIEEHGSPRVIIFDGESMEYFEVDTEKKTWAVATLRDAVTQGKAHGVQDIKAIDKALLPELRYHAIAERQERLALWIHLLKNTYFYPTTIHSTVAGQPCDGYTEHVDGKVVAEGCYIPWGRKTIRKEDWTSAQWSTSPSSSTWRSLRRSQPEGSTSGKAPSVASLAPLASRPVATTSRGTACPACS